jgi:hypothetical protein
MVSTLCRTHMGNPVSSCAQKWAADSNLGSTNVANSDNIPFALLTSLHSATSFLYVVCNEHTSHLISRDSNPNARSVVFTHLPTTSYPAPSSWPNTHAIQHGKDIANPVSRHRSMCTFIYPAINDCSWLCMTTGPWVHLAMKLKPQIGG